MRISDNQLSHRPKKIDNRSYLMLKKLMKDFDKEEKSTNGLYQHGESTH